MKMLVYKYLADCYYQPDGQLVQAVENLGSQLQNWDQDLVGPALEMQEEIKTQDENLLEINKEYSRLFVGPFQLAAPPYGSVYFQHKRVMDDSTVDVQNAYRRAGIDISGEFNDPPDHIAAELEFMYYLLYHESLAAENEDEASAMDFRTQRLNFMQKHLGVWGPVFADTLTKNSSSPFYRELGRLTKSVLLKDKKELNLIRSSA